jgi:tRNA A-37 threonylcarbamoyl transferase component Bud32
MSGANTPLGLQADIRRWPHAVFVSYSSENKAIAEALCTSFEASDIRCWIAPRDVQGGRPYSGQITQAIREARILLLILTQASNRSKHVLREVERAAHCQNHLLTFRVEPITPTDDLAYFLGADQWVDGFQPLPPSQHFSTLIQHTRALLKASLTQPENEEKTEATSETFAHFRILRHADGSLYRLGKGGMGVTYKAVDTVLNRPVALKVIASELLQSQQAKHRFLREAQAAALIHHPHVATIFQFGEEQDAYFYVMEFVEGEDLERYIARQGPASPATTLRVALQVAQALEAAQARQLIHRDIKPSNIMAISNRSGSLDVKLIDFGLAKGAGAESLDAAKITRTQDFVGSPAFASPEQCESKKLDVRSDIYSLGVTLWYLLTGKRPFSGSVGEVMVAQMIKPPPFDELAQVPEPVISLLRQMLEKSPSNRFQNPEELQEAIEAAATRLSGEFRAVPERIITELTPDENLLSPAAQQNEDLEPIARSTLASPLFDNYLAVQTGAFLANRYRLVSEEREGNGGRLFRAIDEREPNNQSSEVGVKLLHPGIGREPALLDLIENELGVIRQAPHAHLLRYYRLERPSQGPCILREWVNGFAVYELLRWRHTLKPTELGPLLDPLAETLDFVAGQGLGLVDVSVRKLLVVCPVDSEGFEALAKGDAQGWSRCVLKLNPLSVAPLLFQSRNGWDRQTMVPATRVLSMTQAEAGLKGTKAVHLYGRLVYELLSGRAPARRSDAQAYIPLAVLDQASNEILRDACVSRGGRYRTCQEFWSALSESIATPVRRSSKPGSAPAEAPVARVPRSPLRLGPPKLIVLLGMMALVILIVALWIGGVSRFFGPGHTTVVTPAPSVPMVTPIPIASETPAAPVAVATPTAAQTILPPSPVVIASPAPSPSAVVTPPAPVARSTADLSPVSTPSPAVVTTQKATPVATPQQKLPAAIPAPNLTTPERNAREATERPATGTFDGQWSVTLYTSDYKDPVTGALAKGYTITFPATIKDGVVHAEYNIHGHFEISGTIKPDGNALLHLAGTTGPQQYTMNNARPGTPYSYDIATHFEGSRGTGKRVGPRTGVFEFAKK